MKNIVLVKTYPTIQLGHLYEHLFLRRVNEFFYQKKLFKSLDYAAQGMTFEQGGVIVIDIDLYSDKALHLIDEINQLRIDFGPDHQNITLALHQITAEEPHELYITNKQQIIDQLKMIDQQPWSSIDNFSMLDTTIIRRKNAPIYLTDKPQTKPRTLRVSLTLDSTFCKNNHSLAPLFNTIARLILLTVGNRVTAQYGLYAAELYGQPSPLSVTNELFIAPQLSSSIDLDAIAHLIKAIATDVLSPEVIDTFIRDLTSTNYREHSPVAPNYERIINETGVLIGPTGWQEIATAENINQILEHANLELKFGRKKLFVRFDILIVNDK